MKQATIQETTLFLNRMDYININEFNSSIEEFYSLKSKLIKDFPNLIQGDNKKLIVDALTIMRTEKILPEFNALKPTCEDLNSLALAACGLIYAENNDIDQYLACLGIAADAYLACSGG